MVSVMPHRQYVPVILAGGVLAARRLIALVTPIVVPVATAMLPHSLLLVLGVLRAGWALLVQTLARMVLKCQWTLETVSVNLVGMQ